MRIDTSADVNRITVHRGFQRASCTEALDRAAKHARAHDFHAAHQDMAEAMGLAKRLGNMPLVGACLTALRYTKRVLSADRKAA